MDRRCVLHICEVDLGTRNLITQSLRIRALFQHGLDHSRQRTSVAQPKSLERLIIFHTESATRFRAEWSMRVLIEPELATAFVHRLVRSW